MDIVDRAKGSVTMRENVKDVFRGEFMVSSA